MKKVATIMVSFICAVACNPYDIDEILLIRDDISLTLKGEEMFVYNPLTCQMSHNLKDNEYRVFDDKLSEWFHLICGEMPANKGQEFHADLSWSTAKGARKMNGLTFKVEKTDSEGKIWMWCEQKSIGIVIKNL